VKWREIVSNPIPASQKKRALHYNSNGMPVKLTNLPVKGKQGPGQNSIKEKSNIQSSFSQQ
jgi:hypothetical protein